MEDFGAEDEKAEASCCKRKIQFLACSRACLLLKCVVDGIVVCRCNGGRLAADSQCIEGSPCGGLVTLLSDHWVWGKYMYIYLNQYKQKHCTGASKRNYQSDKYNDNRKDISMQIYEK